LDDDNGNPAAARPASGQYFRFTFWLSWR